MLGKPNSGIGGMPMLHRVRKHRTSTRILVRLMLFFAIIALVACNKPEDGATKEKAAAQKNFASPAEAGAAFYEAAKAGDQNALLAIFGPDAKDLLFSGDPVKDKNA